MLRDRYWNLRLSKKWMALALCVAATAARAIEPGAVLPEGAELHVRLTEPVASATAKVKQAVDVVLIEPVISGERIVLPAGTRMHGFVKEAKAAVAASTDASGAATPAQRSELWLAFDSMTAPGMPTVAIAAKVQGVDNARETVDADGRIQGIDAAKTLTSEADRGISKLAEKYEGFAGLLQKAKSALVKPADPEITYPAGVEMTLALTKPLRLTHVPSNAAPPLQPFSNQDDLVRMVTNQPIRAYAAKPPRPSDLTSMVFIGTEEQIRDAFASAGWSAPTRLDDRSKLETVRALMEDRGYKEGPMSVLLLDGRPPDLEFEKTNDTFAARHHLRIWRRPGTYDGLPIWVVTATHDTGIDFSESDRTFIHKIDPHIDGERSKVINDLLFAGAVRSLALVDRADIPPNATNATGDALITDGRMAVVMLGGGH
jgi:hypothetical protein